VTRRFFWLALAMIGLGTACTMPLVGRQLTPLAATPTDASAAGSSLSPAPLPSLTPDMAYVDKPYEDARAIFAGVCFNYWAEQVNRIYILKTAFDHIHFYNEVDESGLCRFPVVRNPFDFEGGRILIGAINVGTGCWAYTDPIDLVTDNAAKTVIMRVGWAVAGDCAYRLARPFWVSIPRPPDDYQIAFEFVPLE
jgi:hypothetical protein